MLPSTLTARIASGGSQESRRVTLPSTEYSVRAS
jgi:hypothetical protein